MCVYFLGNKLGSTSPISVLKTVMQIKASIAPLNTADRSFLIESTAAMKKVLSPISVAMIILREFTNAGQNLSSSSKCSLLPDFSAAANAKGSISDTAISKMPELCCVDVISILVRPVVVLCDVHVLRCCGSYRYHGTGIVCVLFFLRQRAKRAWNKSLFFRYSRGGQEKE